MPNYVRNLVSFEGEGAEEALRSHMKENGDFDFNTVDEMPSSLAVPYIPLGKDGLRAFIAVNDPRNRVGGSSSEEQERYDAMMCAIMGPRTYAGLKVSFPAELDVLFEKIGAKSMREALALGQAYFENMRRTGFPTWYDWCVAHWGTKWNAMDADVKPDGKTVQFDTAWEAPWPIFEKLAETHPGLTIRTVSSNEDRACGVSERVYRNGGLSEEKEHKYGETGTEELYCSLWPEYR